MLNILIVDISILNNFIFLIYSNCAVNCDVILLQIWRINTKHNILYVNTGVPGPTHGFVRIYDTSQYKRREEIVENGRSVSMPTFYMDDVDAPLPEDIYHEDLFPMSDQTIMFKDEAET